MPTYEGSTNQVKNENKKTRLTDEDKKEAAKPADSGTERTRLSGHFELDLPKPENKADERGKKKKTFKSRLLNDLGKPRFYLEVAVLAVVTAYTAFAGYQSCQMRDANDLTKANAVASNRPWVGVEDGIDPLKVGEKPEVWLDVKNYGHTPALDVAINAVGTVIPHDARYSMTREKVIKLIHNLTWGKSGPLFPNERVDWDIPSDRITADQMNSINKSTAFFVVVGVIEYKDTSLNIIHHTWIFMIYAGDRHVLIPESSAEMPSDD